MSSFLGKRSLSSSDSAKEARFAIPQNFERVEEQKNFFGRAIEVFGLQDLDVPEEIEQANTIFIETCNKFLLGKTVDELEAIQSAYVDLSPPQVLIKLVSNAIISKNALAPQVGSKRSQSSEVESEPIETKKCREDKILSKDYRYLIDTFLKYDPSLRSDFEACLKDEIKSSDFQEAIRKLMLKKKGSLPFIAIFMNRHHLLKSFIGSDIDALNFASKRTIMFPCEVQIRLVHPEDGQLLDEDVQDLILNLASGKTSMIDLLDDDPKITLTNLVNLLTYLDYYELPGLINECVTLLYYIVMYKPEQIENLVKALSPHKIAGKYIFYLILLSNYREYGFSYSYYEQHSILKHNLCKFKSKDIKEEYNNLINKFINTNRVIICGLELSLDSDDVYEIVTLQRDLFKWMDLSIKNKDLVKKMLKYNGGLFECFHVQTRYDREIVLSALQGPGFSLRDANYRFRDDREIVLMAIKLNGLDLEWASANLKSDREIALTAIQQNALAYRHIDETLKNDREIALKAVQQNALAYDYMNDTLKNDREIISVVIQQLEMNILQRSWYVKKNREIVIEAVRKDGNLLDYVDKSFLNDKEVVLIALSSATSIYIQRLSESLKRDPEVILALVKIDRSALEYAHVDLRNDREIVLAAVKKDGRALQFAHEDLKKDREIVSIAVKSCHEALKFAHEDLKGDAEFVLPLMEKYCFINEKFTKDFNLTLAAVKRRGFNLLDAHEDLKKNREIVLAAVQQHGWVYQVVHDDLKKDREIALAAVQQDGAVLKCLIDDLKKDRDIALAAVRQKGTELKYVHEDLRNDREIVLAAVKNDGRALQFAHDDLKKDKEIALLALRTISHLSNYIDKQLKSDPEIVYESVLKGGLFEYAKLATGDFKNNWKIFIRALIAEGDMMLGQWRSSYY